jgi:hypothetical protein
VALVKRAERLLKPEARLNIRVAGQALNAR